jgi:hypothetical protein
VWPGGLSFAAVILAWPVVQADAEIARLPGPKKLSEEKVILSDGGVS